MHSEATEKQTELLENSKRLIGWLIIIVACRATGTENHLHWLYQVEPILSICMMLACVRIADWSCKCTISEVKATARSALCSKKSCKPDPTNHSADHIKCHTCVMHAESNPHSSGLNCEAS